MLLLAAPGPALAATAKPPTTTTVKTVTDPNALSTPSRLDRPPIGHHLTGIKARAIAGRVAKVVTARAGFPRSTAGVFLKGATRWQVSFYATPKRKKEIAQVLIDDTTGAVLEAWTGPQVAWTMARGYKGAFGRKAAALYVWLPLLALFVVPFVDPRRPLRMRHLDLLVLCSFSVSLAFFSHGDIDASVPLTYPPLLYLLVRLAWVGLRRAPARPEPLRLLVPASWLAVAVIFLLGFRIGLNVTNSNVIDVGYSGVIGADKLAHGHALYGTFPKDNPHGDTYGPVTYATYVPFELALPWKGRWDGLPAAHGAAILFDLLAAGGLFLLGRRIRGPTMGIALTYAWVAFPFTLFALNTNANDALVAALLVAALLVAARPMARGAVAALAAAAKFAPLALVPLLATQPPRRTLRFALAFAATAFACLLPVILQGEPRLFYDRTLGFQASRDAPFSVWGLWDWPSAPRTAVQAAALLFAVAVAFVPRRRDVVGLAALAGAVLIALQLGATYWFYIYVVWFFPLVLVALIGQDAEPSRPPAPEPAAARSRPPAMAASSG
ncbi:MAG TPA: hypothetical protein VGJ32_09675 [Solirubrobacteraceae bacterium]